MVYGICNAQVTKELVKGKYLIECMPFGYVICKPFINSEFH